MMTIVDYKPVNLTRAIGMRLSPMDGCPSEISFGNRYNVTEDEWTCAHLSIMTVGCCLPKDHEGPHQAKRSDFDPMDSTNQLADHDFTLTWKD